MEAVFCPLCLECNKLENFVFPFRLFPGEKKVKVVFDDVYVCPNCGTLRYLPNLGKRDN